jgi:hypothetical protein
MTRYNHALGRDLRKLRSLPQIHKVQVYRREFLFFGRTVFACTSCGLKSNKLESLNLSPCKNNDSVDESIQPPRVNIEAACELVIEAVQQQAKSTLCSIDRYIERINYQMHDSDDLEYINEGFNVDVDFRPGCTTLVPDNLCVCIFSNLQCVHQLDYCPGSVKQLYFLFCMFEKNMQRTLDYLRDNPFDRCSSEISPEYCALGSS